MPREHFSKAPDHVRQNLQRWLAAVATHDESAVGAINRIFQAGYDLLKSEIPTPRHDLADKAPGESERIWIKNGDSMAWANEEQAHRLWESHRQWAAETSKEGDEQKAAQQKAAANTERAQITVQRFVDGLAAGVQGFIADQWHRANVTWQQEHQHRNDPTIQPAQPTFNDTVDAVLTRLGFTRTEAPQANRTRKAS